MRSGGRRISAVVVARNEQATIQRCIESVLAQTAHVDEIIVVDGNSTDRTQEIVVDVARQDGRISLMVEEDDASGRGPAAARNVGASAATGELLLFTNGDVAIDPDYVSTLLAEMDRSELDAVAGLRWNVRNSMISGLMNVHYALNYNSSAGAISGPAFLSGDALLIRADSFWSVGGYDPGMPAGEDADLGYRLRGAGLKIGYSSKATIWHEGKHYRSVGDWLKQIEWYGRGAAALARAHRWRVDKELTGLHRNVILPATGFLAFILIMIVAASVAGPVAWAVFMAVTVAGAARYLRAVRRIEQKCSSVSLPTTPLPVDIALYPLFKLTRYGLLSTFTWRALLSSREGRLRSQTGDRTL